MKTVALGEIVDFYSGGTPSKAKPAFWNGSIPWVSAKDMKKPRLSDSSDHISEEVFTSTSLRKLPAGTVVMVVRGMILAHTVPIATLDVPASINQDLKALLPRRDLDPSFLAAMLRAKHAEILAQVSTAAHGTKKLESRVLEAIQIPFPNLNEQRRIASILDRADSLRAKRRRVLSQLEALSQSVFHNMFRTEPATTKVEDLSTFIRTGPFGSQLLHSEFVTSGISVLGLDNVVSNEFRWAERRYITPTKYEQLKRYRVHPGDVLVSIMGTTGRCVVVPDEIPAAINTKHICAITPDQDRLDPIFLRASFLWHPESRTHLRRQTKGSIMDGLNMGIIKTMPVPLPRLDRQREFALHVKRVAFQRTATQRGIVASDELFGSLQACALRGEL